MSRSPSLPLSHSDYCFLVFSSRERAQQQSDVLPSHVLFVCSRSSSANRVQSFAPSLLLPSFYFLASFFSQPVHHPKFSSPLLASCIFPSAKLFYFPPVSSIHSPLPILSIQRSDRYLFICVLHLSIFTSTLITSAVISSLLSIPPIFHLFLHSFLLN